MSIFNIFKRKKKPLYRIVFDVDKHLGDWVVEKNEGLLGWMMEHRFETEDDAKLFVELATKNNRVVAVYYED